MHTFAEKCAAGQAAERVAGVLDVIDELEVRLCVEHRRSDTEILQAAQNAFWLLPHPGVEVESQDGLVTLHGCVEWQVQRHSAEGAVARLTGVRSVSNQITLRQHTPHQDAPHQDVQGVRSAGIAHTIQRAFERRSALDARQVSVAVSGGQVTLSGTLSSWNERQQAVQAAWSALGVTQVDNFIRIEDSRSGAAAPKRIEDDRVKRVLS